MVRLFTVVVMLGTVGCATSDGLAGYAREITQADVIAIVTPLKHGTNKGIEKGEERIDDLDSLLSAVESASRKIVDIKFEITHSIKGDAKGIFEHIGAFDDEIWGYRSHDNYKFWLIDGGSCRSSADSACFARVVPGEAYLALLNKGQDGYELSGSPKALEYIADGKDAWLAEVCRIVSITSKASAIPDSYCADIEPKFETVSPQ